MNLVQVPEHQQNHRTTIRLQRKIHDLAWLPGKVKLSISGVF